jgi:GGDEF domain-containing protein
VEFEAYFAPLDMWLEDHAYPTAHDITIFFRDVTERRRLREELVRLAQHDPLTGLANRALFGERLAAGPAKRPKASRPRPRADRPRRLQGGQRLPRPPGRRQPAEAVRRAPDRPGAPGRHGGALRRRRVRHHPARADRAGGGEEVARRISEAMRQPFDVHDTEVTLGASIGIAMAPEHGTGPEELIFKADLALYRAKAKPGEGVEVLHLRAGPRRPPAIPPPAAAAAAAGLTGPRSQSSRNSRPTLTRLTPP